MVGRETKKKIASASGVALGSSDPLDSFVGVLECQRKGVAYLKKKFCDSFDQTNIKRFSKYLVTLLTPKGSLLSEVGYCTIFVFQKFWNKITK